jgi:hypothetical protein
MALYDRAEAGKMSAHIINKTCFSPGEPALFKGDGL